MNRAIVLPVLVLAATLPAMEARAQPSKAQCMKMIEPAVPGEMGLDCTFKGGQRSTNELDGKKYLTPVGKCWDYDTVVMKSCGCRQFLKASICCRNPGTKECEWRVGDSQEVDCTKWGKPKFGLSGDTESPECAKKRRANACVYNKLKNPWYYPTVGPCMADTTKGGIFECEAATSQGDYDNGKCGPDPASCGCTLREDCSDPAWVACYKDFISFPEGFSCFDPSVRRSNYDRVECYKEMRASKAAGGGDAPAAQ